MPVFTADWGGCDHECARLAILRAGGDPTTIKYSYKDYTKGRFHVWEATAPVWRHKMMLAWWGWAGKVPTPLRGWMWRKAREWWVNPHLKNPAKGGG